MDSGIQLAHSQEICAKVARLWHKRTQHALEQYRDRVGDALAPQVRDDGLLKSWAALANPLEGWRYAVDAAQRSVLYWDTLRERGTNFVEAATQGLKPVLHFDYETVLDARHFERPVNYALLRIVPPDGVVTDDRRRPYMIIDPRAGHGPGIGGFKDDSQVGVALRDGHPVYFVVFYRDPEPGQTMLDVCEAERRFVAKVRDLHPDSPKPAIIGNCQGGWAAMMLASSAPDMTGPIVINGSPMSYWSGAWSEGEGDNPMRYAGGLLGGTWLASYTADLGNGKFDGAWLVQNFENLNLANTFWDKYYHLYENIDTEPERFLDFEKWWGGYYLMNREEIEWITRNLFVGNKLWSGEVTNGNGKSFDLRDIRSPIVLFASMGDNITPPQQAFNWVADLYESTEEIKARGQVIVGLMHETVGHLGIFVSGKVAKKEHAQIVSVLKTIESFPPGLYGMRIEPTADGKDGSAYEVSFTELRLEDVAARLNKFGRVDEKPFQAVAEVSEFNQLAYQLFAQPFVESLSSEAGARVLRGLHPLRVQRWAWSDMNPWLSWLPPAAKAVKDDRRPTEKGNPWRAVEKTGAAMLSASLDCCTALRDAATEALFFGVYANMFTMHLADRHQAREETAHTAVDPRELPYVQQALAAIEEGGYAEAVARVAYLLERKGEPLLLSKLALREQLTTDYADYLPPLSHEEWRRIRGEQDIIVRYEPERAVATLPRLLASAADRKRLLKLIDALQADERVKSELNTEQQRSALSRIRGVLGEPSLLPKAGQGKTPTHT
jgi:pimeloyl-ACP methyl ester carboxylesterase